MRRYLPPVLLALFVAITLWVIPLYMTRIRAIDLCARYTERMETISGAASDLLKQLAAMPATVALNTKAISDVYATAAESNPLYLTVALTDKNGNVLFSTYRQAPGTSVRERKYFADTVAKKGFAAGEFVRGKMTRRGVFHYGYPVFGENGEIRGALNISIDLKHLDEALAIHELPKSAVMTLVEHRGLILFTTDDPERRMGKSIQKDDFAWLKTLKKEGTTLFFDNDGGRWFSSGRQLRLPDGSIYAYMKIDMPAAVAERTSLMLLGWLSVIAGALYILRLVMLKRSAVTSSQDEQ